MGLAVIGAGFGRTGTRSLKMALEHLGFGPCCHGSEERHYKQEGEFWERIFNNLPVDWDGFFDGYRSAVDSPSCRLYRTLAEKYPKARIVLTWRDPTEWYESFRETILPMTSSLRGRQHISFLFGSSMPDRRSIISAYERHNAEVQRSIPEDRLLVYDVRHGWPPLCDFLSVPVPQIAFPQSNARADFARTLDDMLARL